MNRMVVVLLLALLATTLQAQSGAQGSAPQPSKQQVPVMDGGAGPCSIELTVRDPAGKPVYAADVKVHIEYGFAGMRRLDLDASTNSDGKLKFTGLPARVHRPPLEFQATKDDLQGVASYDPTSECHAQHDITLAKQSPQSGS